MSLTTGKTVEIMFEETLKQLEDQDLLLTMVDFRAPEMGRLQHSGNVIWERVEQQAPIISGWDMTGEETEIIEQTVPIVLGTPDNDFVELPIYDVRDERFWKDRAAVSARRQAAEINKNIAIAMKTQGSLFYRSNVTSGYEFIALGQAMMNERQLANTTRNFLLNDRDNLTFASDLAGRQTLQGRPEEIWKKGQIAQGVAGFDNVLTGSFLPTLTGGADPATTVTGNQSFKPEGGSVDTATGIVTNVDYRSASIPVAASASYNVGDKIYFTNTATPVYALGLDDKTNTLQPMTFTIVAKADSTHITVYPKPIAADDTALTTLEAAYANINTVILNGATVNRLNIDATIRVNLFWDKAAVRVMGGNLPADRFQAMSGMKSVSSQMKNGQNLYMFYDGNIEDLTLRFRLLTWYGISVVNPSAVGVGVTY